MDLITYTAITTIPQSGKGKRMEGEGKRFE
jgi:hypothetical protein